MVENSEKDTRTLNNLQKNNLKVLTKLVGGEFKSLGNQLLKIFY